MERKNKDSGEKNGGFPVNAIFCGCSVISGAILYILKFTFDSFTDFIFAPVFAFLGIFLLFGIGAGVMNVIEPEINKFPKWVQKTSVLLLIIGLSLAQYYLLGLIFNK